MDELGPGEIDALLREQRVGRVGCHADGRTYVVPVIYAWDGECVYVQSIEGRKTRMMRANPEVCFEVDDYRADGSWRSVVLDGTYEELEGEAAQQVLALLVERFGGRRRRPARPADGPPGVAFRIRPTAVSGRASGG